MHASTGAAATAAVSLFLFAPFAARAADDLTTAVPLTLDAVLALARERAPQLGFAAARIDAARGHLAGVSGLLPENPVLEVGAGRRLAQEDDDSFALEAAVLQPFELHGGRRARIDAARAALEQESAAHDDSLRRALGEAASAFFATLYAERRVAFARSAEEVAAELARATERRFRADDVPVLDWLPRAGSTRVGRARGRARRASTICAAPSWPCAARRPFSSATSPTCARHRPSAAASRTGCAAKW